MDKSKALEIAKEAMENVDYKYLNHYIALRMLPPEQDEYEVGDSLPKSYRWDNGESTGDRLDGVCAISVGIIDQIDEADFLAPLERVLKYTGCRIAMLRVRSVFGGVDPGEVICYDNLIEFIWTVSEEEQLKRIPRELY